MNTQMKPQATLELLDTAINPESAPAANPTLRRGATGNNVKALQAMLNYRGAGLTVDGNFGPTTEARVIEFQQWTKLTADGIVGPMTWSAIGSGMAIARIPGSAINMRATPDPTAAVVQTLRSEDSVEIQGRSPLMDDKYSWFYVRARQKVGWVREDLIWLLPTFAIPLPIVDGVTIPIRPRPWFAEVNPRIEAAIRGNLNLGFRDRVRYLYRGLDIDGTGPQDVLLVYVFGDQVCGTGGCTVMVMQMTEQGYRVISRITSVQQPVIISTLKTNGYPDLIVYTAGGGIPAAYRYLEFNGKTYPTNPTTARVLPKGIEVRGIALASRITPDLAAPLVSV